MSEKVLEFVRVPAPSVPIRYGEPFSILLVDADRLHAHALEKAFCAEGFSVTRAADGEEAVELERGRPFDLVVLDRRLPGLSGIETCRRIRRESMTRILMLTGDDAEAERVLSFEVGADDCVTKPCSLPEVVARVHAMARRRDMEAGRQAIRRVGGLRIDLGQHEVEVDGILVHLTPSEFRLLSLLSERPGHVFPRAEIIQRLWNSAFVADQRACDIHITHLRRKIELDPGRPRRLVTVRGIGYKLVST